ncbi:MAG: SAM-dependent methyltransferase [Methylophilaceae bacterium]
MPTLPLLSIALISCAALGLEILLMRLFSIVQWHHFAYLAVSLAMLGYGAAGTARVVLGARLHAHFSQIFAVSALLFGLTAPAAFLVAQQVPFNALEILWDARQWLWLTLQYLVLFVPFFFAAFCLCLAFSHFGSQAHRIYGADLWGAAAGSLLALGLLFILPPQRVLLVIAGFALAAAGLAWPPPRHQVGYVLLLAAMALPWVIPDTLLALHPSQYKSLSQTLLVTGAKVKTEKYSPLGQVTVVENPRVPLRYAPGLSLTATREPPPQLGVFVDGEGPAAITRFDGAWEPLTFLGQMPSAMPYQLLQRPSVLVLGAGTGMDVLQALYYEAAVVDAVELDANVAALVAQDNASFAGQLYQLPQVRLHVAEARSFVATSSARYDLMVLPLADTFGTASAGLHGLAADYLHTVEAFRIYFCQLKPGGMLALNRWVQLPPRDLIKLAATAVEALVLEGVTQPARHLALLRGWQSATLLVKQTPFMPREVAALHDFAESQAFDLEWAGGRVAGAMPHHRLDRPYFQEAFAALSGTAHERADFYRRYKFHIAPPTDDRPYLYHFFTWRALPEIMQLKERGGLSLVEMGYPVLVATWLLAMLFGTLLILLPLWAARRRAMGTRTASQRRRVFAYFSLLGMAFMLLEMAFLQKFVLLLGHPLYAAAAVLTTFLLFAGMGSRFSVRLSVKGRRSPTLWPVVGIVSLGVGYLTLQPLMLEAAMGWPMLQRLALGIILIAPLAFCMGMPFPLGMARLAGEDIEMLPWAYGVNACFSVMSASMATLLAMEIGFSGVVLLALGLYLATPFFYRTQSADGRYS